jgi:SMC interacting uncharacterized protein involved in chromosome segregation
MDLITEYLNIIKQQGELIEAKNEEIKLLKNKNSFLRKQVDIYRCNTKAWKDKYEKSRSSTNRYIHIVR